MNNKELENLTSLFIRDIGRVIHELNEFNHEEDIWKLTQGISNSSGTLSLHLIGNLNHFIGSILGKTGYVRQRELEFSSRNVSRTLLIQDLEVVQNVVRTTLPNLSPETLHSDFPQEILGQKMTTHFFLLHLYSHLNYHLGQINYHRRILTN